MAQESTMQYLRRNTPTHVGKLVLLADGLAVRLSLEKGVVSEAVENVIEANILLSGLGFENTGCAGSQALHIGFHEIPETSRMFHGEMVGFGVIFQLVMESQAGEQFGLGPAEAAEYYRGRNDARSILGAEQTELEQVLQFMKSVGLPLTLKQLNVEPTPENIRLISSRVLEGNSGIEAKPFPITEELVYNAIVGADAIGNSYLKGGEL